MSRLSQWLVAWAELGEALVKILTFTYVSPIWSFDLVCWFMDREMSKRIEKETRQ